MKFKSIRKIAAKILKIGESKVWIDSSQAEKIKEAITKDDIRELIKKGAIRKKRIQFQSKGRARILQRQKRKGRKKGFGKRKGTFNARAKKKQSWVKKVRALRKKLKELRSKGNLKKDDFKHFYALVKGNYFKGKRQIEEAVKQSMEKIEEKNQVEETISSGKNKEVND